MAEALEALEEDQPSEVQIGGKAYATIKEGLAYILAPKDAMKPKISKNEQGQSVFYNPIQQFNRDLSVLVINAYGEQTHLEKRLKREKKDVNKRKRDDTEDIPNKAQRQSENQTAATRNGDLKTPPRFRILDALSATGLRALRYAHEIPITTSVTANDLSEAAVEAIKLNIDYNKLSQKIVPSTDNAMLHMYGCAAKGPEGGGKYDVIDLDPYGTAAPFIDAAVQAVADGGLLCVTCTDAGVFAAHAYPEKAFALYGGIPLKGEHSHEAGLRLILHSIATSAARYGMAIEPLLSLSIDYYARVFVRVIKSPAAVKFLSGKTMIVYNCDQGCGAWSTQLLSRTKQMEDRKGGFYYKHGLAQGPSSKESCINCGFRTHLAGPMYGGPIHSPKFVQRVIANVEAASPEIYSTKPRVLGMLQTALEESLAHTSDESETIFSTNPPDEIDPAPFFFIPNAIARIIRCQTPTEAALRGALLHLGYSVTRSHCKGGSIKTNAPWPVVWEIFRHWVKEHPIRDGALTDTTAGAAILKSTFDPRSEPSLQGEDGQPKIFEIKFDEALGKRKDRKLVRYQINPQPNWGPMARAR